MKHRWLYAFFVIAMTVALVSACGPTPEPQVVEKVETKVVKETVKETVVVEGTPQVVEKEVTSVVEKVVTATPEPTQPPSTEPKPGGTLNMSLGPDFVTFDPYYDETNDTFKVPIFEAPVRISDEGGFEPWLAESYEVSDDGLHITLHMRQNIKFHNGRPLTADDVVWSVQRALDVEKGYHLSDRFTTCTGADKIDDYTVQVNYNKVANSALDGIARLYILPQEADETIGTIPVGTGPFKFVEWVPGDHLTLARFEDYWQEGLPYLDEIVVKAIPDPQARMVNLLAGSIDALWGVPDSDRALLEEAEGVVVDASPPGFSFDAFLMNINVPPFDDVRVRQAMNWAVDRDKINQLAFSGEANMTVLPRAPSSWAYPADLEGYYTYDPEKAKALLAEAGYPDGFKTQMLIRGTSGPYLDMAQVYQADLAQIGVDMELLPTELPQYWPKLIDSEFAIVSHGTGDATVDPSGLFEGAACCRPFRNFFGITDNTTWFPEYQALIEEASSSLDQAQRKDLYHQAISILMEQGWTIPIRWRQQVFALKDYVQGFRTDLDGQIWLNEVWLNK
jgi:peptide/nickel transport system substrate-binding protein